MRIDINAQILNRDDGSQHALGRHLILELYNCAPERLDNLTLVEESMTRAAQECQATILNKAFHKFEPQGVSGVLLISESHLAIHTWPEFAYAAVDFFTCSPRCPIAALVTSLQNAFQAGRSQTLEIQRGALQPLPALNPGASTE